MQVALPRNFSLFSSLPSLVHTPVLTFDPDLLLDANHSARLIFMILSNLLPALLGGALAVQGALALDINIGDESPCPAFQAPSPCGLRLT